MARRRSASVRSMSQATRRTWLVGAAIAVGTLIYTTGPLYRVRTWWGYSDPLAVDVIVIFIQVIVGVAAAVGLVRGGRWRRLDRRVALLALALVCWLALGALWSASPSTTLRESLLVGVALVAGAGAAAATNERVLIVSAWTGVQIGLGWSALLIAQMKPGSQDTVGGWTGAYFNPNSLALVAAIGIFLSIVAGLQLAYQSGRNGTSVWFRYGAFAVLGSAAAADLWLVKGTGALTPVFALGVALAVGLGSVAAKRVIGPTGRHPHDARRVSAIAGSTLIVVGAAAWIRRDAWLSSVGQTSELNGRTAMWEVALEWFQERPVVGHGYLGAWYGREFAAQMLAVYGAVLGSAHNTFVELLLGAGVVGFALAFTVFALIWIASGERALVLAGPAAMWPLAVLVFVIVENLAETLLVGGQLTVAIVGALAVVSASYEATQPSAAAVDVADLDVVGVEWRG